MGLHSGRMPKSSYFYSFCLFSCDGHGQGSINNRINILYFLDSLCETSLLAKTHPTSQSSDKSSNNCFYVDYVSRDLGKIIEYVVPEGRQGLPNLMSTKQVYSLAAHYTLI